MTHDMVTRLREEYAEIILKLRREVQEKDREIVKLKELISQSHSLSS